VFVLSALVYPCVLAALCIGAGLLVDRASGGFLHGSLLPAVGGAALIAVSQLTTYSGATAPATPYVMAMVALAGFALGWPRASALARAWRTGVWQLAVPVLAFVAALAPVLFAGRTTFSSYQILPDSAFHMMGADFLMRHGQDYAHLDLRNSYGAYINTYFNASYPSGSHTLFGGSAFLLHIPLIWAFQPFNAFMLATAAGPAWLLARRLGLNGGWAALSALTTTLPALVYGYELVGSMKEVTAMPLILTLAVLTVSHVRWLRGPPRAAVPFALVTAGGVSALGVAFGAWVLPAVVVLAVIAVRDVRSGRERARHLVGLVATGVAVMLAGAAGTWIDLSGSLQTAQNIASTTNPGNLQTALRTIQVAGTWLVDSYRHIPVGGQLDLTYAMVVITIAAGAAGLLYLVHAREHALAGWIAVTLVVGVGLTAYGTTWTDAKALMLTSPAVMLVAWAGVAALRGVASRAAASHAAASRAAASTVAAAVLALALTGAVLASDAMQYHGADLAPTARYREMASLNDRFAGRGPALFTDFDEYALYELRNLDVGGPDFANPPPALGAVTNGHGERVDLDRIRPAALLGYPLIIMRIDPTQSRPPSAYRLVWQGTYYQVWRRRPAAAAAIAHLRLSAAVPVACARVGRLAHVAGQHGAQLVAAAGVELVAIDLARSRHPAWALKRLGILMPRPGRLSAHFAVPRTGVWDVWLQGEIMRAVRVRVDGHSIGSIAAQVSGDIANTDTMTPLPVRLSAGTHHVTITRGGASLAPGDGGSAFLHAIFFTPAGPGSREALLALPAAQWRSLCGRRLDWVEAVSGAAA
jgi:hypothetical protein